MYKLDGSKLEMPGMTSSSRFGYSEWLSAINDEKNGVGGNWKSTDDTYLASIVNLGALSSGDQETLKDLWHRWYRRHHYTPLSSSELAQLHGLFVSAAP